MKNIPNRSTISASTVKGEGALPLVIIGALVILIVVVLVGDYVFTDCQAIYFVKTKYERDNWPLNLDVLRHEVAHVVVGCGHGHGEAWKREFDRLMALAPPPHGIGDRAGD